MTNKHRKVWKVVSRKVNSGKQTWPKCWMIKLKRNNRFKKGKKTQENSSKPSQTSNPLNPRLRLNQKA
jgi:hypothetical protein